ncbi:MAG: NTP transferase domain-containing protein [Alphaproteobacteria bacterium]|nr:NTP transferase domain-containing protein [Alphaproteobacteria bacterium]
MRDIEKCLVGPNVPLRSALGRLNEGPQSFLVVVDEERRLLGTVTDGDIRRGVLRGVNLDDPLSSCMHREPETAFVGDSGIERTLLNVPFLPLLEPSGRIVSVALRVTPEDAIEVALIMAGGLGSRLGEITDSTPKPLVSVGGRPILEHIMGKLEAAGIGRILVSVNHLAEQIEDFVRNRENQARIEILREDRKLGTAGALSLLPTSHRGTLLVLNGDVLTDVDFGALLEFHRRHGHDGTIGVAHHQIQVPFGVVRHDESGMFVGIDEKPVLKHFVAAGIYLFSPDILQLVPKNCRIDMPDLLNQAKVLGRRIGIFPIHEYWADVGNSADLDAANKFHRHKNAQDD